MYYIFLAKLQDKRKKNDAVKVGNTEHLTSKPQLNGISTKDTNLNDSFSSVKENQLHESHL